MQSWLRSGSESPTLAPRRAKSASRVGWHPEGEMALLRERVTPETIVPMDPRPVIH